MTVRFWDIGGEEFELDLKQSLGPNEKSTVGNWKKYFAKSRDTPISMIELFKVVFYVRNDDEANTNTDSDSRSSTAAEDGNSN